MSKLANHCRIPPESDYISLHDWLSWYEAHLGISAALACSIVVLGLKWVLVFSFWHAGVCTAWFDPKGTHSCEKQRLGRDILNSKVERQANYVRWKATENYFSTCKSMWVFMLQSLGIYGKCQCKTHYLFCSCFFQPSVGNMFREWMIWQSRKHNKR